MTEPVVDPAPWGHFEKIVDSGDADALNAFVESLSPGDAARAMARLVPEDQNRVLATLAPDDAADLIDDLPPAQAADLMGQIPADLAAAIMHALPSAGQADLVTGMSDPEAAAVLAELAPDEARDIRELASHDADVAGGLMFTEFLAFREDATVGDVIGDLRANADRYADYDVQYTYVTTDEGRLVGVLRLRDLLLSPARRPLQAIMIREPVTVLATAPLDELVEVLSRGALRALPVVDASGRLLGVVHRASLEEALGDRAGADGLKMLGIVGGEELRTMPLLLRSRRRLSWLSINIVLNVVAASVIAFFEETLAAVIALAFFLPIISDMSGCSGNQAVAVSIRELTLGMVRPHELAYVWLKEIGIGVVNGTILGLLIGMVALLWKGNMYLGLVVGSALTANTMVAVSIGGVVPLLLRRFNMDPALASGPVLTTITDICGFFFVLGFATLMLSRLAPS